MRLRKFPLIAGRSFLNYEYRWKWIRRNLNERYTTWPPLGKQNRGSFQKNLYGISCFVFSFEPFSNWSFYACGRLALSSAEALGEKEKESARGTMGRGREKRGSRLFPLPILSARFLFFDTQRELMRGELALSIVSPLELTIQCNYTLF